MRINDEGGKEIPLFKVFMPESVIGPLRETLFSGYIGEGPRVEEFERRLAPWFGNGNVLALNNATAGIQLALRLAGVKPGDEVISTPMTCVATNQPILAMGAKVVWADIDPWTGNIDPESVAKKISPKTKAVIAVHWGGYPCDLDELNSLAKRHGIKIIEDASHAFGAEYHLKPVGAHSDFVVASFQAVKEMTTVDGGALICKSGPDHERGRLLRWYGMDRKNRPADLRCEEDIKEYGYKFHMNDVAAAIGIEQLKYVSDNIGKHCANAERYNEAFGDLGTVRILRYKNDRISSCWLYTLRVKDRSGFIEDMNASGIAASKVHTRNDRYSIFKDSLVGLPGVDEFEAEHVCIPVGWWLTEDDIRRVIDTVIRYDHSMRQMA